MLKPTMDDIVRMLELRPLPEEGGLFRETYRSALSTAIYYLLTPDHFSAIHRVRGDEVFHFYLGDPVEMLLLIPDGSGNVVTLGSDLAAGMRPQVVVRGGVWQGSRLRDGGAYALLGTTMAPGFEVADFELGDRATLVTKYPAFAGAITRFTRDV